MPTLKKKQVFYGYNVLPCVSFCRFCAIFQVSRAQHGPLPWPHSDSTCWSVNTIDSESVRQHTIESERRKCWLNRWSYEYVGVHRQAELTPTHGFALVNRSVRLPGIDVSGLRTDRTAWTDSICKRVKLRWSSHVISNQSSDLKEETQINPRP